MKDLPITRVDYDFINEFNVFLRSKYRCGQNTTVRHLRHLKQIICEAIAKGYLNKNPFHGILLPIKKSDRAYLIKSEIEKVINVKLKQRTLIDIRNIFIFCCYTGLSYIDVMNLRKNDIIRNESGEQYILKRRIKSGIQYYIPLFNTPIKIMESYEEYTFPDKKIFPYYACQNMNKYLKDIMVLCGINKKITTHCSRHNKYSFQLIISNLQICFRQ